MAGFTAGTPQNLLASAVTCAANSTTDVCEITIDGAAFGEIQVDITTNASASAGCDVFLVRIVDNEDSTNKYQVLSVDANASEKLNFVLQAGKYRLKVKNNDSSYAATVNAVTLLTYTWS